VENSDPDEVSIFLGYYKVQEDHDEDSQEADALQNSVKDKPSVG
jgi:hypothetical protein